MKKLLFLALPVLFFFSSSYSDENRIPLNARELPSETKQQIEKNTKEDLKQGHANQKNLNYYDFDFYPPMYLSYGCHQLTSVSALGDSFTIEDGSQWYVKSGHHNKILTWAAQDKLIIVRNDSALSRWFGNYNYKIINQTFYNDSAEVKLHMGPQIDSSYTLLVIGIDSYRMEVILSDGSIWKIQNSYASSLSSWLINDGIIIGTNFPWFWNSDFSYMLINVNLNNDVPACLLK